VKVHFIIEDPFHRRSGYNPFISSFTIFPTISNINEIPGATYSTNRLASEDESGNIELDNESIEFTLSPVLKGTYTLIMFGIENTKYIYEVNLYDFNHNLFEPYFLGSYISTTSISESKFYLDPTPGAPPPVLTKIVTFQTLKEDIEVAYKLNQIGDEKFKDSLIRMLNIAEKYYNKCQVLNNKSNDKKDIDKRKLCYRPVVATVRMMMKRLEVINKLCDNPKECKPRCKTKPECDEDEVFKGFDNKYRKDAEFKDFFSEWDKDEYHKHKKTCKRYITDEALEIITTDINWLIKGFGEEVWNDYKKEHNPYIPEKYKSFFK